MQFNSKPNEPFWRYFERFKDLLPISSSWHREVAIISNSLRRFRLPNQDPPRNYVPRGILVKG